MLLNPYRFGGIGRVVNYTPDPYARKVSLWIDGQGTPGATQLVDQSPYGNQTTNDSLALAVTAADKRYGAQSVYVPISTVPNCGQVDFGDIQPTNEAGPFNTGAPAFNVTTQDWTWEVSLKLDGNSAGYNGSTGFVVLHLAQTEAPNRVVVYIDPSNKLRFNRYNAQDVLPNNYDFTAAFAAGWVDVAITRQGALITYYVNGVSVASMNSDSSGSFAGATFGNGNGGFYFGNAGGGFHWANARFTRGVARVITPLTTVLPLPIVADPVTLNLQFEGLSGATALWDEAAGGAVAVNAGTALTDSVSYWGRTALSLAGANDSGIAVSPLNAPNLGEVFEAASFTVSGMVQFAALPTQCPGGLAMIASCASGVTGWNLYMETNRNLVFTSLLTDGTLFITGPLRAVVCHKWAFVAVVRVGNHVWVTVDGLPVSYGYVEGSKSFSTPAVTALWFGYQGDNYNMNGYLDDLRIKNGAADVNPQWASTLPPGGFGHTWPSGFTNDQYWADVGLLLNNDLSDQGPYRYTVTNFGATVSSAQQVNGQPMIHIGAAQFFTVANGPNMAFGTGDFTVEFDFYSQNTSFGGNNGLLSPRGGFGDATWCVDMYKNQMVWTNLSDGSQQMYIWPPEKTLCHITFMRRGNWLLGWCNDMLQDAKYFSNPQNLSYGGSPLVVGKLPWGNGIADVYIANIRITKGRARINPKYTHSLPSKPMGKRYARLDNYDRGSGVALTTNDLVFTGSNAVRSNVGVSSGKWYWEITSNGNRYPIVGVGASSAQVNGSASYPGFDLNGWGYFGLVGKRINGGSQITYGLLWAAPTDVIGVYLDMDNRTLGFTKNGVDMGIAYTGLPAGTLYAMIGGDTSSATSNATVNFGQLAFSYAPPVGYNAGLYENNIDDVVTYTPLVDDTPYQVGFQLTGQSNHRQNSIIYDTGRYAFRQTTVPVDAYYQSKVVASGDTALYLPGTGNLLSYPVGSTLDWTQTRWTLRCRFYELAGSGGALLSRRSSTVNGGTTGWAWQTSGLRANINGAWSETQISFARPSLNTWHDAELIKDGSSLSFSVDGVVVGSLVGVTAFGDANGVDLFVGSSLAQGENLFIGYINDLEFWPGVAMRAVAAPDFVPPSVPFDATDPNWSYVKALLHFDGADGSTAITDSGPVGHVFTAQGTAKLTAAQQMFGGSSLLVGGSTTGNNVTGGASADWILGNTAFTIECFVYLLAYNSNGGRLVSSGGGALAWNSTNGIHWLIQSTTAGIDVQFANTALSGPVDAVAPVPLTQWTHIAVDYDGTTLRLFAGGQLKAVVVAALGVPSSIPTLMFGAISGETNASTAFSGYIDEFCLFKGVSRHSQSTSFAPPVRAKTAYPPVPSMATVRLWLDSSDASSLMVDGANHVQSWKDKITGTVYTPGAGSGVVSLVSGVLANPYVDFGTARAWLESATGVGFNRICTIFIVGYWGNSSANLKMGQGLFAHSATDAIEQSTGAPMYVITTHTNGGGGAEFVGDNPATNYHYDTTFPLSKGAGYLVEFQQELTPQLAKLLLNGSQNKATSGTGWYPEQNSIKVIGALDTSWLPNGGFAEILAVEGYIPLPTRQQIRNYLAAKWKLQ